MLDRELNTDFRQRVCEGDVEAAREHLDSGAEVDGRCIGWYTALMDAAFEGHRPMLTLLLQRGADVDAVDGEYGTTSLFKALQGDHWDAARLLIEHGADPTVGQVSPVRSAVEHDLPESLFLLLAAGVDPNDVETFHQSLLMEAVGRGHARIVTVLLQAGADVEWEEDITHSTALSLAARSGHTEIAKLLLDHGAKVDIALAAHLGLEDRVREFLDNGIDPNTMGVRLRTPLQSAVVGGHVAVLKLLIDHGADVNFGDGWKPLKIAEKMEDSEIAALLKSAGAR